MQGRRTAWLDPYRTPGALEEKLTGAWFLCKPARGSSAPGHGGQAVFTGSGQWLGLTSDGAGGLDEGKGRRNHGTWFPINLDDASAVCDDGCIVQDTIDDGEIVQFGVQFERSPRRMSIGDDWNVPLE